jgi:hypothetical protein
MTILLKKPGKDNYSNPSAYRSIVLLNILGKILKTVIARRMRYIVKTHNLLSETQMRIKRERLTKTALYLFTEKVYII